MLSFYILFKNISITAKEIKNKNQVSIIAVASNYLNQLFLKTIHYII